MGFVDPESTQLFVRGYWRAALDAPGCRDYPTQLVVPSGVAPDVTLVDEATWHYPQPLRCSAEGSGVDVPNVALSTRDEITFRAPIRRIALDGGQYDASPMTIVRNGVPGATYHCGDRLGLVATESNWDDANRAKAPELANWPARLSKDDIFELTTLPPPWIEDDVVEYVNSHDFPAQPGGHFFLRDVGGCQGDAGRLACMDANRQRVQERRLRQRVSLLWRQKWRPEHTPLHR